MPIPMMRRPSEESIRTEDCEGPVPDTPMEEEKAAGVGNKGEALCTDRAELILSLKRWERPTWVPNRAVSGIYLQIHFH